MNFKFPYHYIVIGITIVLGIAVHQSFFTSDQRVVYRAEVLDASDKAVDEIVRIYRAHGMSVDEDVIFKMREASREALIGILESNGYVVEIRKTEEPD